jgi:hypothetical protein
MAEWKHLSTGYTRDSRQIRIMRRMGAR